MDINANIRELIIALLDGDRCDAIELAQALASWLDSDGYMPDTIVVTATLQVILSRRRD